MSSERLAPSERHRANAVAAGTVFTVALFMGWGWLAVPVALTIPFSLTAFADARADERRAATMLMFKTPTNGRK